MDGFGLIQHDRKSLCKAAVSIVDILFFVLLFCFFWVPGDSFFFLFLQTVSTAFSFFFSPSLFEALKQDLLPNANDSSFVLGGGNLDANADAFQKLKFARE